jgi:hypothetical protein
LHLPFRLLPCSFFRAGVKIVDFLEDMCSRQEVPFEMKEFAEHLYTLLTSLEGECFAIMKVGLAESCNPATTSP